MVFTHLLFPVLTRFADRKEFKGAARLASSLAAKLTPLRVVDSFREGGRPDTAAGIAGPDRPIRRILCAVSGRDSRVLETAAAISERTGARLFVLHVVPEVHEGLLAYGFDDHVALSAENGMRILADLQRKCGTDGQPIVEIGDRERCIAKAAKALRAELVVTGRRQRKPSRWSFATAGATLAPKASYQSVIV